MVRPVPVVSLLLVAVLAGCLSDEGEDRTEPDPVPTVDLNAFLSPMLLDHDHADPSLHRMWWNMERTGGSLLDEGMRGYAAPHALDVKAGRLFVSAYAMTGDEVAGLYIFDLAADPADPPLLGKWLRAGGGGGDRNMEATEDGAFVVIGYEAYDCAGNVHPVQPGMYLIDTSDPSAPEEVDWVPVTDNNAGHHSITVYSSEAGDFVYHGAGDGRLYRIDRGTRSLEEVGEFMSGHDSSLFWDPLEARTLLLSADVSALTIYDLADPSAPRELGAWPVPDPDRYYVHTAVADHIAGRNIAIVNSEDFRDHPTRFWVLDITDPTSPELLSDWTAPGNVASGPLTFSLHNPRMENGVLTFSFYHTGVWQFDLSDPERWTDPRPRAYYVPHDPVGRMGEPDAHEVMSLVCGARLMTPDLRLDIRMDAVPLTFDVELHGGFVYAADVNTGIHVLRFDPDAGMAHPAPGQG